MRVTIRGGLRMLGHLQVVLARRNPATNLLTTLPDRKHRLSYVDQPEGSVQADVDVSKQSLSTLNCHISVRSVPKRSRLSMTGSAMRSLCIYRLSNGSADFMDLGLRRSTPQSFAVFSAAKLRPAMPILSRTTTLHVRIVV